MSEGTNFTVLTASNTRSAIEILKTEVITFVVSNINLDNFDGWRLARMVRSGVLNCAAETPFVLVAYWYPYWLTTHREALLFWYYSIQPHNQGLCKTASGKA